MKAILVRSVVFSLILSGFSIAAHAQALINTKIVREAAALKLDPKQYDANVFKLRGAVRLEPEMLTVKSKGFAVELRPLRSLPLYQQQALIPHVEGLIVDLLSKPRGTLPPLISEAEAKGWARKSEITFGPPLTARRVNELSLDEIREVIDAYIEHINKEGGWERYDRVQERVILRPKGELQINSNLLEGGRSILVWTFAPRTPAEFATAFPPIPADVRREAEQAAADRRNKRFGNSYPAVQKFQKQIRDGIDEYGLKVGNSMRLIAADALCTFAHPKYGRPLLEAAQRDVLKLRGFVQYDAKWPGEYTKFEDSFGETFATQLPPGERDASARQDASRNAVSNLTRVGPPAGLDLAKTPDANVRFPAAAAEAAAQPQRILTTDFQAFQGGSVNALAFSPDGHWLAAAGDVIRIWNLDNGQLEHTLRTEQLRGGGNGFLDVKFTPDGRELVAAVAGTDRSLRVYDVGDFSKYTVVLGGHQGHIERIAVSDRHLATSATDRSVILWDWPTRKKIKASLLAAKAAHLSFADMDDIFVINQINQAARVFRIPSVELMAPAVEPTEPVIDAIKKGGGLPYEGVLLPGTFATGPLGKDFVFGGHKLYPDGRRQYWAAAYFQKDYKPARTVFSGHRYVVTACALHLDPGSEYDGKALCASADATGQIVVWNRENAAVLHRFVTLASPNYVAAFGENETQWQFGDKVYQGAAWRDNHYSPVHWQFDLAQRHLSPIPVRDVAIPVGDQALSIRLNRPQRTAQGTLPPPAIQVLAGGKVARQLPFASGWDVLSHLLLRSGDDGKPAGVVVGNESGGLILLDASTLMPKRHFMGHTDRVWGAAESPGAGAGKYLLSTGGDGTLRLWGLANFKSKYNVGVLTDSDDRVIHVYDASPAKGKLQIGDWIQKIDGLTTREYVNDPRAERKPAGPAPVVVQRGGRPLTVQVELSNMGDIAKPLLTAFVSKTTQDWIVWTENGYYDCSPGADRLLGWHENRGVEVPSTFLAASQVQQQFRRPDVIDLLLEHGDEAKALAAANERRSPGGAVEAPVAVTPTTDPSATGIGAPAPTSLSIAPAIKSVPESPVVRILEPANNSFRRVDEDTITAKVSVVFAASLPDPKVAFEVNGNPIAAGAAAMGDTGGAVRPGFKRIIREAKIPLAGGRNEIKALATTAGVASSDTVASAIVHRVNDDAKKPKLLMLTIGVNEYKREDYKDLQYAKADADALKAAVSKMRSSRYSKVVVESLTDAEATAGGIRGKIDELVSIAAPGDSLVLHVSAHGFDKAGKYYLLPHGGDPDKAFATCISWATLTELAVSVPNVRLALFVDTCRSGGATGSIFGDSSGSISAARTVFAACGAKQASVEYRRWGHGAFTLALLEALANKPLYTETPWPENIKPDSNGNGQLTTEELSTFVRERVEQLTGEQQSPEASVQQVGGAFVLFDVPEK